MSAHEVLMPDVDPVTRWSPGRKFEVIRQLHAGEITRAHVMARHRLSAEELDSWVDGYRRHGMCGLKATQLQAVR